MTTTDLQPWAARLDARERALQGEVRGKDAEAADEGGGSPATEVADEVERADGNLRGAMRHAERERDLMELEAIAAARGRIADGSFGECTDCGVDIPTARLEAEPWAARCVPCQEKFEAAHPTGARVPLPPAV